MVTRYDTCTGVCIHQYGTVSLCVCIHTCDMVLTVIDKFVYDAPYSFNPPFANSQSMWQHSCTGREGRAPNRCRWPHSSPRWCLRARNLVCVGEGGICRRGRRYSHLTKIRGVIGNDGGPTNKELGQGGAGQRGVMIAQRPLAGRATVRLIVINRACRMRRKTPSGGEAA
jgi:hypothetical protein